MREIRTSGLMSGDGRRGGAEWLNYRAHPRLYQKNAVLSKALLIDRVECVVLRVGTRAQLRHRRPAKIKAGWWFLFDGTAESSFASQTCVVPKRQLPDKLVIHNNIL